MTLNLLRHIFLALTLTGITAATLFILDINPLRALTRWHEERRLTEHTVRCRQCFATTLIEELPARYLCATGRAIIGYAETTDRPN